MFSSLRARLWLTYALMIGTALSVVAAVLLWFLINNPLSQRQTVERTRVARDLILQNWQQILDSNDPAALGRVTGELQVRVLVFGPDRGLRLDSQPGEPALAFPRRPFLARFIPAAQDAQGRSWVYSLDRLPEGGWLMVAALRPRVPVWNVISDELLLPLLEGAAVALAFSLVLAFVFSRWIADPMQQVVAAARGFPSVEARAVPEGGPREVRELTRAFNAMVARIQAGQRSQRDFVADVSHELKTPLTSVQGFAQAILDGTADTPEARRQAAGVIFSEAGRMHRMVLDLLDLARLEGGTADLKMVALDVRALLQGIVTRFGPQAEHAQVLLRLEIPDQLPALIGDGDRLAQVFSNLLDNALKYTPAGGAITLRAGQAASEMKFEVEDTGRGIPEDAVGRIFDRFYQVDPSRPGGEGRGAGLGLAIVQEIVHAHGGRISVRSQHGRGTTVTLNLPLAQSAVNAPAHRKK